MSATVANGNQEQEVPQTGKETTACLPWPIPPPNSSPEITYKKLFINNEWKESVSDVTMAIINPATEKVIAHVAMAAKEDVDKAVHAAKTCADVDSNWRGMDASDRGSLLMKLADAIDENKHYLSCLESLNSGKPYTHTFFMDTLGISKILRYYAGWTDKIHGKTLPIDGDYLSYTNVVPVGVCGLLLPWNMPLISLAMKMAPALCCGNTLVIKPSEYTPLTTLFVASLAKQVGFPEGVINVIPGGPETGKAITEHPDVAMISLTGSVKVGQEVEKACALNFKKLTLELSGKCPIIVFPDVQVDSVVEQSHQAAFMNQGQMCTAGSRTFVHEDIYDEFVSKSVARAQKRILADPFELFCEQGPQIAEKFLKNVLDKIDNAVKEGAQIECGGKRHGEVGYYIQPTVLTNVTDDMAIAKNEIFGPVQCIFKFKTKEEVIKSANSTIFGLATGIFSNDVTSALEVASRIDTGTTWINCFNTFSPAATFGGLKMSGKGKEMGKEALAEYSQKRTVTIKMPKTLGLKSTAISAYAMKSVE